MRDRRSRTRQDVEIVAVRISGLAVAPDEPAVPEHHVGSKQTVLGEDPDRRAPGAAQGLVELVDLLGDMEGNADSKLVGDLAGTTQYGRRAIERLVGDKQA